MKKTLAMLLVLAMVASLCCMMFVSADESNLLAGKEYEISEQFRAGGADVGWGYSETAPISYPDNGFELTDGYVPTNEDAYDADCWMGFNQQTPAQKERGYAYVNFDLGEVCSLSEFSFTALKDIPTGIQPAYDVEYLVSLDGEEYFSAGKNVLDTDALAALEDKAAHTFKTEVNVSARYIQIRFISYGWNFLGEIEAIGVVGGDAPAPGAGEEPAPEVETWEDTYTVLENGNASVGVPYGYTWTIDDIDGKITGEDTTLITNQDAYMGCNPNWAITLYLEKQADGTYVAIRDAIVGPGSAEAAGIEVDADHVAFVVHSSSSRPTDAEQYPNWQAKVVAMATKAGDVFEIDLDAMTVYAVIPGGGSTGPVEVEETIVLDGELNDTGYTNAVWFADGLWQSNKETDPKIADLDVQYTVRADDTNIYLTIKVNRTVEFDAPLPEEAYTDTTKFNQVGSTNFRIWLCGDGMESRTFYDLLWDGEKFETFRAKVLTEEITYNAGIGDDYINLEMAIAKESLAITDSFKLMVTYSSPYCGEGDNVGYNAFHMTAVEEMPSGWSSNTDAYETYACADIALGTYTVEDEGGNEDEENNAREELEAELEELVGAPVETPAYTWNIETAVDETGKVTVTVTLSGVDAANMQCIEGFLHYDAEVLELLTTADKENALLCLTEPTGSAGEWENMSALVEDGYIRLGAVTFGSATMSDEDPMTFTLEFQLAEGVKLAGLYIDTADSYGMDVDANTVLGNGAYGVVEVEEEEEPSTPESKPDDDESKTPGAGDAGILVFAVLGILAIAGAAVVIKVRN